MDSVAHTWRTLRNGAPGERFAAFYFARERRESHRIHVLDLSAGVLFVAVGFVLLFIPGPGIPFLAVGAALLARESLGLARLLDRLEMAIRRLVGRKKTRPAPAE